MPVSYPTIYNWVRSSAILDMTEAELPSVKIADIARSVIAQIRFDKPCWADEAGEITLTGGDLDALHEAAGYLTAERFAGTPGGREMVDAVKSAKVGPVEIQFSQGGAGGADGYASAWKALGYLALGRITRVCKPVSAPPRLSMFGLAGKRRALEGRGS